MQSATFEAAANIVKLNAEIPETEIPLQEFDTLFCASKDWSSVSNCPKPNACKAFRFLISGRPLSDAGYKSFKADLSKESRESIAVNEIPDMDGDGTPDLLEEFAIVPLKMHSTPSLEICGREEWGEPLNIAPKPVTYIFSMSGGKRAMVSATILFLRGRDSPESSK